MTINIARNKQGRRFDIGSTLLRRCSRVALGLLRLSFGNISAMPRFSLGDVSVQNHTSEHNVSMILRSIMLMVMMLTFGTNVSWGATITYHIINLGRLDDNGQLTTTRTEALQFTSTSPTVGVPDKYKSPLAKNWQYYSSSDVTYNSSTKVCVFNSGPSLSVGDELPGDADVYVTYELDADQFREVGIYNRGIYRIKFPNDYYLKQTMYETEVNTNPVKNPTASETEFLWKFNIIDPYQITVQSQSQNTDANCFNYFLCTSNTSNFDDIRLKTLSNAKTTKVWAFGLLNGGTSGTYRLVVSDGFNGGGNPISGRDSYNHGYLNSNYVKKSANKTTYQRYDGNSYKNCDLTFEAVTRNYVIVNTLGNPIVQALTENETLEVPDVIKSPLASYTYYGTKQDAIDEGTQLTTATGATIYVRYNTNNVLNLKGEVKYNVSVGGTNYLYAADATTLGSEATSDNNANNNHKWTLTGNDAYQITIKNVGNSNEITYNLSSSEAVSLSGTGSKFFLHQTNSGEYEVVAITSNDYSTPNYYTLGMDAGNLKLYSNNSHAFGETEIKTVFTPRPMATITTLPAANSLTYNGSNQELVTSGSASNGTMKYRIGDTGSYETSIPAAKDANTYSVYYMAAGADGYEDFIASEPIEVTIHKQSITVSGIIASNKTYDGNTSATLVYTGATLTGKVGSEDLTVSATGTFADKNVGTDKIVNITGYTLGGTGAGNYVIAESGNQASTTANITAAEITVTGITATNKVYNSTTTATLDYSSVILTGKVVADDLSVTATGTFADANVGIGKAVAISGLTLGGADSGNYVLAASGQQTETIADINAKTVTITANDASKNYDGTALTESGFTATPLEEGDTHTFTVVMTAESTITNAGTQPNVIATVDGVPVTTGTETAVGNYLVTTVNGTLTINGIIVNLASWVYGSPKDPSVTGNTGGGKVTYSYKVQGAADDTYSTAKPVNVGSYTVKADIAATETTAAATATKDFSITPATLTIKAVAKSKDYLDPDPELTYTVSGLQNNDIERNVIICVLQRVSGENIGSYDITENTSQRKLKSNNYTFSSFTKETFTINPKNLGNGEIPAPGIGINMKDESPKTVSVYNGENALLSTDFTYAISEPDENNQYTVTITAQGNNCTGSAQATYSSVANDFFHSIDANDPQSDKIAVYTSTSDQMASADLVPCIVGQVNPTMGTISIIPLSYIPKDVPVILLAKHDVTGLTTSPKNENTSAISESLLNSNKLLIAPDEPSDPDDPTSVHGVHVEDTEAYMYYKGEFVLTTEGTIKTGNFYLYNPNYHQEPSTDPSPAPKRSLAIIKGETTGIIQLVDDKTGEGLSDVWYTIDGQKLNKKPTRKGLYIHNGKKHIVK